MVDLWKFNYPESEGGGEYEVDVDTVGGLHKYIQQNPGAIVGYKVGGLADTQAVPFSGPSSPQHYAQQHAELKAAYPSDYQFEDPWAGRNQDSPVAPPTTPVGSPAANLYGPDNPSNWAEGANQPTDPVWDPLRQLPRSGDPRLFNNPDAYAPQRNLTQQQSAELGPQLYMGEMGGYSPGKYEYDFGESLEGQPKQLGGYNPTDPEAQFAVNQDFDTRRWGDNYNVVEQGATDAAPIGKPSKNTDVNSAITNAYMDPSSQNGINVMLDLLNNGTTNPDGSRVPLDEASREAVLLNIGQLYTAQQTSNPYGYTADDFAEQARLDRMSQEAIARDGLTQSEAAIQRALDEQYRQGQLTNEEYAIQSQRYAAEQNVEAARKTAGGVKAAATSAANAARDVAEMEATSANYAAALQANTARYANDAQFFAQMANVASQERIAGMANLTQAGVAGIQKDAAIAVAQANNISAEAVAALSAGAAEQVAIQQGWSAQQVADIQKQMNVAVAEATGLTETAVANTMSSAQRYAADQQATAAENVATTQAQAARDVAATQAGADRDVAAAQATAAQNVATTNATSASAVATATGQSQEAVANIMAEVQQSVATANNTTAENVATINATSAADAVLQTGLSQAAVATIQAESAAAVAAATGASEQAIANIMASAQTTAAATSANPFGLSGQQFMDMQQQQARGGLTAEQRLAEISAANEPERLAALMGALNPNVQGALQGFGMAAPPTVPTISNLRNTSAERQQYLEGLFGSFGVSPSMLANLVQSVSPGTPFGASTFA